MQRIPTRFHDRLTKYLFSLNDTGVKHTSEAGVGSTSLSLSSSTASSAMVAVYGRAAMTGISVLRSLYRNWSTTSQRG